jgi:acyl-CoA thioester hydrolase
MQLGNPFIYTVRVRYADADPMQVVYHSRYLEWFESARTEMLRQMGFPYRQMVSDGYHLPVIEAYCRYRLPVHYDELVEVRTAMEEISRLKIRLGYRVFVQGHPELRAEGWTLHCFTDPKGKPVRAPQRLIDRLQSKAFDTGRRRSAC